MSDRLKKLMEENNARIDQVAEVSRVVKMSKGINELKLLADRDGRSTNSWLLDLARSLKAE